MKGMPPSSRYPLGAAGNMGFGEENNIQSSRFTSVCLCAFDLDLHCLDLMKSGVVVNGRNGDIFFLFYWEIGIYYYYYYYFLCCLGTHAFVLGVDDFDCGLDCFCVRVCARIM